jgi:hypothetical protein
VQEQAAEHDEDIGPERRKQLQPEPRGDAEDQSRDAVRRQSHRHFDDLDDDVLQRLQDIEHRTRARHRDERQRRTEHQPEKDQADHVHVHRRLQRVVRDDVDQRLNAEVLLFRDRYPGRRVGGIGLKKTRSDILGNARTRAYRENEEDAQRCRQGGAHEEVGDRLASDAPNLPKVAKAGDAKRDRGEDQRHHDHEEQSEKDLPDRSSDVLVDPDDRLVCPPERQVHDDPEDGAEDETDEDLRMKRQAFAAMGDRFAHGFSMGGGGSTGTGPAPRRNVERRYPYTK